MAPGISSRLPDVDSARRCVRIRWGGAVPLRRTCRTGEFWLYRWSVGGPHTARGGSMADLHGTLKAYVDNGSVPGAVGLVARGNRMEVAAVGSMAVGGAAMARDSIFRFA